MPKAPIHTIQIPKEQVPFNISKGQVWETKAVAELGLPRKLRFKVGGDDLGEFVLQTGGDFDSAEEPRFMHLSLRIYRLADIDKLVLAADGIVSAGRNSSPNIHETGTVAFRFQPLVLGERYGLDPTFKGRSPIWRGLHYPGVVTPGTVTISCLCDECHSPFCLKPFHAGFSELQYFYSQDGQQTLVIPYSRYSNMPRQLSDVGWEEFDNRLQELFPKERFRFHNPLRCPHCQAPYVDFETYPDARQKEYYGHAHVGTPWTQEMGAVN